MDFHEARDCAQECVSIVVSGRNGGSPGLGGDWAFVFWGVERMRIRESKDQSVWAGGAGERGIR